MTAPVRLKLGTRRSALALAQSQLAADLLKARHHGLQIEIVPIVSAGDKAVDVPFGSAGVVGMFVKELEGALLSGEIDFAVHSLKDLPVEETPGLAIQAVPERGTPYDVLITRDGSILDDLPEGARIGTGSLRRQAQMLAYREDLRMVELRGNIETRIARLDSGRCDGIVLAAAGIERLGLQERVAEIFTPDIMLPAVGQGCLALQVRSDDKRVGTLLAAIDDHGSHQAAIAERALLAGLGGGCHAPIAALAHVESRRVYLTGLVGTPDGRTILREEQEGVAASAAAVGKKLADRLLKMGADEILDSLKPKE